MIFTLSDLNRVEEAERIVDTDLRRIRMGHKKFMRPINIPDGYSGPLDEEAIHRFTMNDGLDALSQQELINGVKELDDAGEEPMYTPTDVQDEEVRILKTWIRLRDADHDAAVLDSVDKTFRKNFGGSDVGKVERMFKDSFVKTRRYRRLWAEIMGLDARRRGRHSEALRFYGIILQNEWCHVTA